MLFVSRFPFDFYPVDNDGLYLIVYRGKERGQPLTEDNFFM
jgi:hypothetical protein